MTPTHIAEAIAVLCGAFTLGILLARFPIIPLLFLAAVMLFGYDAVGAYLARLVGR